ncbi:MAG: hypothetical protein CSA33_03360 [Desulfobulbus propionicus]|nr:MAG: hypothetical protein CSA33_03360 [Desulfobulbus propionicus]
MAKIFMHNNAGARRVRERCFCFAFKEFFVFVDDKKMSQDLILSPSARRRGEWFRGTCLNLLAFRSEIKDVSLRII